ncbi:Bacterial regulatory protein, tetR family [compost metagenome]
MKDQIAEAAGREIMQRGLRFSIRDLAGRLGISTKTVYQYFESKEMIIQFLVEQSVSDMKQKEQLLMEDHTLGAHERLSQALIVLPQAFAFTSMHVLEELKRHYPNQWRIVDDYLNQGWDNIRVLFREGMERGELRPFDPELFIQTYVGGMYQIMENKSSGGQLLQQALSGMVELLLTGIYNRGISAQEGTR